MFRIYGITILAVFIEGGPVTPVAVNLTVYVPAAAYLWLGEAVVSRGDQTAHLVGIQGIAAILSPSLKASHSADSLLFSCIFIKI